MNQRIQSALSFLPSENRDIWLMAAMAIRSEEGDAGFDVWDAWGQTADNHSPSSAKAVWRSCRGTPGRGITMGSLFHEAKLRGWRDDDNYVPPTAAQIEARRREQQERMTREGQEREAAMRAAAKRAAWILHQAVPEEHAYLYSHGMPKAKGQVWRPQPEMNLLCIPMRVGPNLVGLQLIDRHGTKKFLKGQRTSGAEYLIDNSGKGARDWWVEGYCNGLALRECLSAANLKYRIHICFSAGNMANIAKAAGTGIVLADNDESMTGENAAKSTGLPYWMSEVVGEDLCDFWQRRGTFATSRALVGWLSAL